MPLVKPLSVLVGSTPTNASNLGVIVSDGTLIQQQATSGTGNIARVTSPVLVAPTLGVASATSVNNLTITSSTGTLTIAAAKVVTVNNALTLAGTDSTTITFQGTDTYVGRATTDTFTNKTFNSSATGNVLQVSGVTVSSGQYPGTATNDAATAGNVGQLILASVAAGSAVSLTNNIAANVTSISLTAGDWDISAAGMWTFGATTTVSDFVCSVSTTSATQDLTVGKNVQWSFNALVVGANASPTLTIPTTQVTLSGTTTVYLVATAGFGVSTAAAFGIIRARRVR